MTDHVLAKFLDDHKRIMAEPRRCPVCQVTWACEPSGYATYRQVPVWNPPEESPSAVCFKCIPPDWGGATGARGVEAELLDEADERWDAHMREIERIQYNNGDYTDKKSPTEDRDR
jgi:hypothetical protein